MTPKRKYQNDIEQLGFKEDEAQLKAIEALDELYINLIDYLNAPIENKGKTWHKWFKKDGKCSADSKRFVSMGWCWSRKDIFDGLFLRVFTNE